MTLPPGLARLAALVLAAGSGVLVFLAYPNWNLHYFAWFALVPLLLAARQATVWQGLGLGLLAGTVTNFGGFHWMTEMLREFGHMSAPPAWAIFSLQAVTQGLAYALGIAAWRWLARRGAPVALSAFLCLWAGEVALPMLFPWFLGNAISPELEMVQVAELGGVHLVSAMLFAANAALAEPLLALADRRRPAWRFMAVTALSVALAAAYGHLRIPQIDAMQKSAPSMKIGMVEGNVGIWEKEAKYLDGPTRALTLRNNLLKHQQMSASLEQRGAELIVWPESAYQPYGANPVLHTTDRFLLVGDGGAILRHDGKGLLAERPDRLGLPRDLGLLAALSSPRGDIWRALDGGRRVVTVTSQGAWRVDLPAGETAVTTVATPVDPYGRLEPGLVVARNGKVWQLDFLPAAAAPARQAGAAPSAQAPQWPALQPLPTGNLGAVDVTAAARNALGRVALVGRSGALLRLEPGGRVERVPSPVLADLWTIAADPQGALFVAAGDGGTVLQGDGRRWTAAQLGESHLYAAWFGPDGTAYVAGQRGAWYARKPRGRWQKQPEPAPVDLLAGAADAQGRLLLVGRGGRVFAGSPGERPVEVNSGSRGEVTAVLGYQATPSYSIPRSARRLLPSLAPLPDAALPFPRNVQADEDTPEFDRSTPRRGFRAPLLFGAMTHGGALPERNAGCTDCYNSAVLQDGDGRILALHDKAFLLMFGEYLPFGEDFPQLYELSPETSRFQAGTRTAPIVVGKARAGLLICYEDLVPRYARRVAAHDPNVFINLTNDAWFGKTAEPYHHLNLALMRTVEYRRWLLRSTNTGVSVFIDAVGRRVAETSLDGAETLLEDVPLIEMRTVYAQLGDWPLIALAAALLLVTARTVRGGTTPATAKPKSSPRKKKPKKDAAAETLEPTRLKR